MRKAVGFIVVTAGAPLVALAIGVPAAWAAPSGNGASVSINDTTHGSPNSSSTAFSFPSGISKPNVAVAVNGSEAQALGRNGAGGNTAIAINNSSASAAVGSNNTAIAINNSRANAAGGDATATAINNSRAIAIYNGTATAVCGGNATAGPGQTVTSNGGTCGK